MDNIRKIEAEHTAAQATVANTRTECSKLTQQVNDLVNKIDGIHTKWELAKTSKASNKDCLEYTNSQSWRIAKNKGWIVNI